MDTVLHILQSRIELRQFGALLRQNVQNRIGDVVDEFVIHHDLHDVVNGRVLDPIFLDGLFITTHLPLGVGTFIVAMDRPRMALAALADHKRAAFSAKEFCRQNVVVLRLTHGGSLLIACHDLLHAVKKLLGNDGRNGVGNGHVAELILADIPPVLEKIVDDVERDLVPLRRAHAAPRQIFGNIRHLLAVGIAHKYFYDNGRGGFVDFQALILHAIAERQTAAVHLALQGVFGKPAPDFFGEIDRIVLCPAFEHRFEQYALGAVGDVFLRGNDLYTVLFENVFIVGGVVAVAGEAIQLPNEYGIEQFAIAVFDHALKVGTVVRLGRERTVDVCTEHGNAVALGKFHTLADLPLDALLSLVVRAIPSVNNCFHLLIPPPH